jgi:hypothetical protein
MATSMRQEADFWKDREKNFCDWQNIQETYLSASAAIPAFPPVPEDTSLNNPLSIEVGQNRWHLVNSKP